ncbi:MAG: DUF4344 domain-containing metallopeptidase [Rhizobiaceae bacterium]
MKYGFNARYGWSRFSFWVALAISVLCKTAFAETKTNQIRFAYEVPKEQYLIEIYKDVKSRRTLERLQEFLSPFRLPHELKYTFKSCHGEEDAFHFDYDITLCYELIDKLQQTAPGKPTQNGLSPHDAVAGPFFSIALHEFAHGLFFLLEVPIFGREEDAADQLAAYIVLLLDKTIANRLIKGTAYAYLTDFDEQYDWSPSKHASEHGTPRQRYYNLLCLAYGAYPKQLLYEDIVKTLPDNRADVCQDEFEQIEDAYRTVILPHVDRELAQKVWGQFKVRKQ